MSARVPARRVLINEDDIVSGRSVRSRTWLTAAELANWTLGNGDVLVPGYDPAQAIAAGASKVFNYRVTPNGRAVRRVWRIYAIGSTRSGSITITAGAMASKTVEIPAEPTIAVPIEYIEDLSAKSSATQTLTLTIANGASSVAVVTIAGISCNEAPRAVLALDTTDMGIDTRSEWAREPIDARPNYSIGGLLDAQNSMAGASSKQRRVSYLAFARPDNTADCWSDAAGVYVPLLTAGHILTRKLYVTSTTGTVRFYFYCSASNATTDGEILITNDTTAGNVTCTVTNPGTGWAWYSADLAFACEDLSEANGLPGGTFASSTFTITFRRAGDAGTFYVSSACAEEIP